MDLGDIFDRWDYGTIGAAPKPCQYLFACLAAEAAVSNGGFASLHYNPSRAIIPLAIEGFSALGLDGLAELTRQANELYKNVYDETGALISEDEISEEDEAFGESLDRRFFAECDACGFEEALADYVRKNAECFGEA